MGINPSCRGLGLWAFLVALSPPVAPEARGNLGHSGEALGVAVRVLEKHAKGPAIPAHREGESNGEQLTDAQIADLIDRMDPERQRRLRDAYLKLQRANKWPPSSPLDTAYGTIDMVAKLIEEFHKLEKGKTPSPPEPIPDFPDITGPAKDGPPLTGKTAGLPQDYPEGEKNSQPVFPGPEGPVEPEAFVAQQPTGPQAKTPGRGFLPPGRGRPDPMQELEALLLNRRPAPRRLSRETERKLIQRERRSARNTPHLAPTPQPESADAPKKVSATTGPLPSPEAEPVKTAAPTGPTPLPPPSPFRFPLRAPAFRPPLAVSSPPAREPASVVSVSAPAAPAAEPAPFAPGPEPATITGGEPVETASAPETIPLTRPPSLTAKWASQFPPALKTAANWIGLEKDLTVEEELPPGEEDPAGGEGPVAITVSNTGGSGAANPVLIATIPTGFRTRLAGAPGEETAGAQAAAEPPPGDATVRSRIGTIAARIGEGFSWLLPQRADVIRFARQTLGLEEAQAVRLYETVRVLAWLATALWLGGLLQQGLRWLPLTPSPTGMLVQQEPEPGEND